MDAQYTLSLYGPSGTLFRITDGASRCVGTGMYRMELDLPPGLYTVSATFGRSVETRTVLLDRAQSLDWAASLRSFGDRAFSLGPDVLAAIGPHEFRPGGQLIALRGPWHSNEVLDMGVALNRDGAPVAASAEGFVSDPQAPGVWRWQLFDLAPEEVTHGTAPGVLSVTRRLTEPGPRTPDGSDPQASRQRQVSHVLPQWGDWMVWAAYPASVEAAPEQEGLPTAYYVRLRLTLPGETPDLKLQGLSDQVFTALAARTGLPFSKLVLDQILLSDQADPMLALGAAHLASIALGWLGRQTRLAQDASPAGTPKEEDDLRPVDANDIERRFRDWLVRHEDGLLGMSPDMVAVRQLFGLSPRAHLREPPVLLRSLDALLQNEAALDALQRTAVTLDRNVWSQRLQLSESFAFLQWQSDANYEAQVAASVQRSLKQLETLRSTDRVIQTARLEFEQERQGVFGEPAAVRILRSPGFRSAPHESFGAPFEAPFDAGLPGDREPPSRHIEWAAWAPTSLDPAAGADTQGEGAYAPSPDLEAFIQSSATSLRMPASAMSTLEPVLRQPSPQQSPIDATLLQWSQQLKAD